MKWAELEMVTLNNINQIQKDKYQMFSLISESRYNGKKRI
jgi:hypothetical protein